MTSQEDEYTCCDYCGGTGSVDGVYGSVTCPACLWNDICPICGTEMDVSAETERSVCPQCGYVWSW